jgi:hypothetical protein
MKDYYAHLLTLRKRQRNLPSIGKSFITADAKKGAL